MEGGEKGRVLEGPSTLDMPGTGGMQSWSRGGAQASQPGPRTWMQVVPGQGLHARMAVAVHPSSAWMRASVAGKAGASAAAALPPAARPSRARCRRSATSSGSTRAAASAAPTPQWPSNTHSSDADPGTGVGSGMGHSRHATSCAEELGRKGGGVCSQKFGRRGQGFGMQQASDCAPHTPTHALAESRHAVSNNSTLPRQSNPLIPSPLQ